MVAVSLKNDDTSSLVLGGGRRAGEARGGFFQAEDGIRDRSPSRGLGDVYKRQPNCFAMTFTEACEFENMSKRVTSHFNSLK